MCWVGRVAFARRKQLDGVHGEYGGEIVGDAGLFEGDSGLYSGLAIEGTPPAKLDLRAVIVLREAPIEVIELEKVLVDDVATHGTRLSIGHLETHAVEGDDTI
ncbi:hypothetical protein EV182_007878 [Spiromyces aspiralis]|uniref:Uncharacterized protein n=1 Tax=Spiromyces aspiralis TaxID=68401 RepID=A0ACC1HJ42_9FUNG|nr:hypothetical protein EV182_007878 [Spiromyces aspiralis]